MPLTRRTEESAPPRTHRPALQVVVFLCITYSIALAIALALPQADIAPLLSIGVLVIAVTLTVAFTVPRGQRRKVWGRVGSICVAGEDC